jgi:hypothetical protein|tara:strand:+ start:3961 stop:4374 length:414 start_codon:yes stop_codon:yes gene_type:complete
MKSLRQIVELTKVDIIPDPDAVSNGKAYDYTNPRPSEKAFIDKHLDNVQHELHPAFKTQAEQDAVFKGGTVSKDHSKLSGHKDGEDADVYESAIQFVKDQLTEDNLMSFEAMLEEDFETAIEFAVEIASEYAEGGDL